MELGDDIDRGVFGLCRSIALISKLSASRMSRSTAFSLTNERHASPSSSLSVRVVTESMALDDDEDVSKSKAGNVELETALAESRLYEESLKEETTMRKLRIQLAEETRRDELAQLNARTYEAIKAAVEQSPNDDLREVIRVVASTYAAEAKSIEERGPRGGLSLSRDNPLCRVCHNYHGLPQWRGLCSRCHVVSTSVTPVTEAACAPSLFKAVGRALRQRVRRSLPAPPSLEQRHSARKILEQRLLKHRMKGHDVKADGACQFRAISHQLFDDESHHQIVRKRAMDYLREHKPRVFDCEVYVSRQHADSPNVQVTKVGDDLAKYMEAMVKDTSWGDATTLQACADVFSVRILLVTTYDTSYELIIEPEREIAIKEIWIGFHSEMHYISVKPF